MKHQARSVGFAVVGEGQVLKTNALGAGSGVRGGFKVLTRTAQPNTPGDLTDVNGEPLMRFGANSVKGSTVRCDQHTAWTMCQSGISV